MSLTEFLTARLDEDEAVACRAAAEPSGTQLTSETFAPYVHFTRFGPARVLAEVEAKRRIVAWFSERQMIYTPTMLHEDPTDPAMYTPGRLVHEADAPVLRFLALPYADHPDYDEKWRP